MGEWQRPRAWINGGLGLSFALLALGAAGAGPPPIPASVSVADLGSNRALPPELRSHFNPLPLPPPRLFWLAPKDGSGAEPPLNFPLDQAAWEVSPFQWRYSEQRRGWRMHAGVDLVAPEGDPVRPARAGRVLLVDTISGYGITVVLDHGAGRQSLYGHLSAVDVEPGMWVETSSLLGRVGQTGQASGPHLHFEWRQRQGDQMLAVDPYPLFGLSPQALPISRLP